MVLGTRGSVPASRAGARTGVTPGGPVRPHSLWPVTAADLPLVREYTQRIEAPPAAVFPLLCPVREGEWLDGWAEGCELVHSRSGVAEPGCVFRTSHPGHPVTTWVITTHDPQAGVVEFARVTPDVDATTLRIVVSEDALRPQRRPHPVCRRPAVERGRTARRAPLGAGAVRGGHAVVGEVDEPLPVDGAALAAR